jgi:hypothetical protein
MLLITALAACALLGLAEVVSIGRGTVGLSHLPQRKLLTTMRARVRVPAE